VSAKNSFMESGMGFIVEVEEWMVSDGESEAL
jgi:hypothetical protein